MHLGQIIEELGKAENKTATVRWGFSSPHSSRGYYEDVAFTPAENVSIQSMLDNATRALGATFQGWKGGDFTMHEYTTCWIEADGNWDNNGISAQLINYWMQETGNSHVVDIKMSY